MGDLKVTAAGNSMCLRFQSGPISRVSPSSVVANSEAIPSVGKLGVVDHLSGFVKYSVFGKAN